MLNLLQPSRISQVGSHKRVKKTTPEGEEESTAKGFAKQNTAYSPLLFFSLIGGMAKEATVFYKRLASLLSERWEQPYSMTMGWLRCTLGFSLLWSSIQCLWGTRSSIHRPVRCLPVNVIQSETHFPLQLTPNLTTQYFLLISMPYYIILQLPVCIIVKERKLIVMNY